MHNSLHLRTSNSQSFPPPWQPRVYRVNYFYWTQSILESVPYIEHKGEYRMPGIKKKLYYILHPLILHCLNFPSSYHGEAFDKDRLLVLHLDVWPILSLFLCLMLGSIQISFFYMYLFSFPSITNWGDYIFSIALIYFCLLCYRLGDHRCVCVFISRLSLCCIPENNTIL